MTISLRNLPPEVESAIVEKSQREGISLNRAATQLLLTALHRPKLNRDFEAFLGIWSEEEAAEFDGVLEELRKVDEADWV